MSDHDLIHDILIERDVDAFVRRDWPGAAADFNEQVFAGYSGASGQVRLTYPSLHAYGTAWAEQADRYADLDPAQLTTQLRAAQRLNLIDVAHGTALATKVFDGDLTGPAGVEHLGWTTHYFLRHDDDQNRWLITGFVGYLATESAA